MDIAKYIGVPYENKGRSFAGADCYGLYMLFNKEELHKDIPEYGYTHAEDKTSVHIAITHNAKKWHEVTEPEAGDLILFRIGGHIIHCGVYLDSQTFLHCLRGRDATIEDLSSVTWTNRIHRIIRWQT